MYISQPDASSLIMNKVVTYMLTHKRKFHQRQHHMKILSSLYLVHTQDILFGAVEFQRRYRKNHFVLGDSYLTRVIFSMCCTESYCTRWYKGVKYESPSTKGFLQYLRWNSTAPKRISCVCTEYKEDNIFI